MTDEITEPTPGQRAIIATLEKRLREDRVKIDRHLQPGDVANWLGWNQGQLWCGYCGPIKIMKLDGTLDTRRCDRCRRTKPYADVTHYSFTVTGLATYEPLIIATKLCTDCDAAP